jgi:putative addiction module component (TIGR02574 family)
MKKNVSLSDLMELSVTERLELVEDLWDTIAEIPESVELTAEQKCFLDERILRYHSNPDEGSPWEQVKARIRNK